MARSVGEILKTNKAGLGLDEVDVRHWIERYLFNLLGGRVRCSKVDGGTVTLVAKSSTIRQELQLVTDDLSKEALVQVGYRITCVKITRF